MHKHIHKKKQENDFTSFDISLSSATRAFAVFSIPRVISTGFAPAATTYKIKFHSKMRPQSCNNKQNQIKHLLVTYYLNTFCNKTLSQNNRGSSSVTSQIICLGGRLSNQFSTNILNRILQLHLFNANANRTSDETPHISNSLKKIIQVKS